MEVTHAEEEAVLTVSDAVRITRLSADTIRRYSNSGKLATFRTPSNHRRFRETDVRALITRSTPHEAPAESASPADSVGASSFSNVA